MTYKELLEITQEKKRKAIHDLADALKGDCGFLMRDELERNPGNVAWVYLAMEFCDTLSDNLTEIYGSADEYTQREIYDIYTSYVDGDPDLYELLPIEAKLFDY